MLISCVLFACDRLRIFKAEFAGRDGAARAAGLTLGAANRRIGGALEAAALAVWHFTDNASSEGRDEAPARGQDMSESTDGGGLSRHLAAVSGEYLGLVLRRRSGGETGVGRYNGSDGEYATVGSLCRECCDQYVAGRTTPGEHAIAKGRDDLVSVLIRLSGS